MSDGTSPPDPPRGEPRITTILTHEPLDVAAAHLDVADPSCGGTTVFTGAVRDHHDGDAVTALSYEAWEGRAEDELGRVAEEVVAAHPAVRAVHLAHRLGPLAIGEVSVVVAASAPHRAQAFDAARALIDTLKERVPIWKRESLADGSTRWPGAPDPAAVESSDEPD